MREYISANLKVIKKHFKKDQKSFRIKWISITQEFKEWSEDSLAKDQPIWTLPDLTRTERLNNFCRSIKQVR